MAETKKWSKKFWIDLGERVGSTLLYGLATWLTLSQTTTLDFEAVAGRRTPCGLVPHQGTGRESPRSGERRLISACTAGSRGAARSRLTSYC